MTDRDTLDRVRALAAAAAVAAAVAAGSRPARRQVHDAALLLVRGAAPPAHTAASTRGYHPASSLTAGQPGSRISESAGCLAVDGVTTGASLHRVCTVSDARRPLPDAADACPADACPFGAD